MHVTLAVVVSLDGKLTRGDDPNVHAWASKEDWQHFMKLRATHDGLILDRVTYEAVKPEADPRWLRVVLTHHPALYAQRVVAGQLEFMHGSPAEILAHFKAAGKKRVLLAGGSTSIYAFLQSGLVDDIYITFEPRLFGTGTSFVANKELDVLLQLQEVQTLNKQGTLLAHYTVVKPAVD